MGHISARGGAAAGVPVVFGVIIGTGTGGGIVVNGRVVAGRNAVAGEWGHNPLPGEWPGAICYCATLYRSTRVWRTRTKARDEGESRNTR